MPASSPASSASSLPPASAARPVIEHGDPARLAALVADPAVHLDPAILAQMLDAHPTDDRLHAAMIGRAWLPPKIVLRLGTLVASHRIPHLVRRHAAPGRPSLQAVRTSAAG